MDRFSFWSKSGPCDFSQDESTLDRTPVVPIHRPVSRVPSLPSTRLLRIDTRSSTLTPQGRGRGETVTQTQTPRSVEYEPSPSLSSPSLAYTSSPSSPPWLTRPIRHSFVRHSSYSNHPSSFSSSGSTGVVVPAPVPIPIPSNSTLNLKPTVVGVGAGAELVPVPVSVPVFDNVIGNFHPNSTMTFTNDSEMDGGLGALPRRRPSYNLGIGTQNGTPSPPTPTRTKPRPLGNARLVLLAIFSLGLLSLLGTGYMVIGHLILRAISHSTSTSTSTFISTPNPNPFHTATLISSAQSGSIGGAMLALPILIIFLILYRFRSFLFSTPSPPTIHPNDLGFAVHSRTGGRPANPSRISWKSDVEVDIHVKDQADIHSPDSRSPPSSVRYRHSVGVGFDAGVGHAGMGPGTVGMSGMDGNDPSINVSTGHRNTPSITMPRPLYTTPPPDFFEDDTDEEQEKSPIGIFRKKRMSIRSWSSHGGLSGIGSGSRSVSRPTTGNKSRPGTGNWSRPTTGNKSRPGTGNSSRLGTSEAMRIFSRPGTSEAMRIFSRPGTSGTMGTGTGIGMGMWNLNGQHQHQHQLFPNHTPPHSHSDSQTQTQTQSPLPCHSPKLNLNLNFNQSISFILLILLFLLLGGIAGPLGYSVSKPLSSSHPHNGRGGGGGGGGGYNGLGGVGNERTLEVTVTVLGVKNAAEAGLMGGAVLGPVLLILVGLGVSRLEGTK